ncbi:hypothetical protein WA556_006634 [Blastocystis sp. ATCC 50177/Nand II]
MDDDSLGAEFCDVLSTAHVAPTASRGTGGMSSYLKNEIQKQLDQSCIEISSWCGEILNEPVSPDLLSSLRDGTVLCRVGETLYPNNPPEKWIKAPKEYMDFNVNITIFGDHCLLLGINKDLVVDYTLFDDRDLARLTTCLFEYIDFYNRACTASRLPPVGGKPEGVDKRMETVDGKPETANNGNAQSSANIGGNRSDLNSAIENAASTSLTEGLIEPQNQQAPKKRYFCCCFLRE